MKKTILILCFAVLLAILPHAFVSAAIAGDLELLFADSSLSAASSGDFDNDGDADLAIAVYVPAQGYDLRILWNDGTGGFGTATTVLSYLSWIDKVETADMDGNGLDDIVVFLGANIESYGIDVLLQKPAAPFEEHRSMFASTMPVVNGMYFADLDGDSADEAVLTFQAEDPALFDFRLGDLVRYAFPGGSDIHDLDFADLNADGWLDAVITRSDGLFVALRTGSLAFIVSAVNQTLYNLTASVVTDFDGDALIDIVSIWESTYNTTYLAHYEWSAEAGTLTLVTYYGDSFELDSFFASDLDDDGYDEWIGLSGIGVEELDFDDLFQADDIPNYPFTPYGTTLYSFQRSGGSYYREVWFEDLDGDGVEDLLVREHGHLLALFRGASIPRVTYVDVGNSAPPTRFKPTYLVDDAIFGQTAYSAAYGFGDIDGDGRLDIVVAQGDEAAIAFHPNDGSFTFADAITLAYDDFVGMPTGLTNLRTTIPHDFDGDHLDDLLLTFDGMQVIVLNRGDYLFEAVFSAPTEAMTVIDLDGDGDLDLIPARIVDNHLDILLNDGTGHFTPKTTGLPTDSLSNYPALGIDDVDGDGLPDLCYVGSALVNNVNTQVLKIYVQDGNHDFGYYGMAPRYDSYVFFDYDGDGDQDYVGRNYNSIDLYGHRQDAATRTFAATGSQDYLFRMGGSSYLKELDIDGDGTAEVLFQGPASTIVEALRFTPAIGITPDTPPALTIPTNLVLQYVDFDGDGLVDVIGATQDGLLFYENRTDEDLVYASYPADCTKTGYDLDGFFADADLTVPFPFATPLAGEATVYAKWTPHRYEAKFYDLATDGYVTVEVPFGTPIGDIEIPAAIQREGYSITFQTQPSNQTTMPAGTVYLYPTYVPRDYTVTFEDADGNLLGTRSVTFGASLSWISAPNPPYLPYQSFAGWTPALPETMPAHDLTVRPTYEPILFPIKFYQGMVLLDSAEYAYGADLSDLVFPVPPEIEGMVFDAWSPGTIPATMPASSLSFYALYRTLTFTVTIETPAGSSERTYDYNAELGANFQIPNVTGYRFTGYRLDGVDVESLAGIRVTADMTVTILMEPLVYDVTFAAPNVDAIVVGVPYGTLVTIPASILREGYETTFQDEFGRDIDLATVAVTADMLVYYSLHDVTTPVFTDTTIALVVRESGLSTWQFHMPTATDNSGDAPVVAIVYITDGDGVEVAPADAKAALLEGRVLVFHYTATDASSNVALDTITVSLADDVAPTVEGVASGTIHPYGSVLTLTFTEGTALLDGVAVTSGIVVSASGMHTLVVTDDHGNAATIDFIILEATDGAAGLAWLWVLLALLLISGGVALFARLRPDLVAKLRTRLAANAKVQAALARFRSCPVRPAVVRFAKRVRDAIVTAAKDVLRFLAALYETIRELFTRKRK